MSAPRDNGDNRPHYHRHDNASIAIATESQNEINRYREERDQEEYYYIHSRPQSEASEYATMNFLVDDRLEHLAHDEYEEDIRHHRSSRQHEQIDSYAYDDHQERRHQQHGYGSYERQRDMSVDYSTQDFQQSRAIIDAASRTGAVSQNDNVRVRQIGNTTIISEHRDPYSFYWQLDELRRAEEDPPRRLPPTDYVIDEEEVPLQETAILSPDSHDSGINFESQYSKPQKTEEVKQLPAGWEKHEDPSGFSYYWHVDSGTIQREKPEPPLPRPEIPSPPLAAAPPPQRVTQYVQVQTDPEPQVIQQLPPAQPIIEEHAFKQTTTKRRVENQDESDREEIIEDGHNKPVRFAVRSLGWTEIPEEDLTAERSSRAVNRAIVELSTGLMDNVAKWGDGRELIMELDDNELSLIDPDSMAVVHAERIHQIRVWGVGRDNGRDFAYVARDRNSRRFLCHVFRCDTPARTIANTLRDICKKLMLQRRPTALEGLEQNTERRLLRESSLPTPIDEPKKIIRCHFLGVTQVPRATGIDILNEAVDRLVSQVRPERWILADVSIAPSTITINEVGGGQIAQCRVRYLSFLGIGQDIKHCAFIMHTSSENYMCYVFHVEPNAGTMAKTIEAACKLRYQKVLDAHLKKGTPTGSFALSNHSQHSKVF
uniref:PID domain-containing protein n=1 Tax=Panagrellus redivivus TaxID=6233 RepID=A0A7E4VDR7_PANRE